MRNESHGADAVSTQNSPYDRGVQLFRLPVGATFHDYFGQQTFEKIGEVSVCRTRRRLHVLRCVDSPFTRLPGPVCAAFFCEVGSVVFIGGAKRVWPLRKEAA